MLRELKTSDIFTLSRILKKMNLKNELKVAEKSQKQVGAEIILTAFENLHMAEKEVNEFLADLAGIEVEEFKNLEIEKSLEIIGEVKKLKGISNFFKSAGQSTTEK